MNHRTRIDELADEIIYKMTLGTLTEEEHVRMAQEIEILEEQSKRAKGDMEGLYHVKCEYRLESVRDGHVTYIGRIVDVKKMLKRGAETIYAAIDTGSPLCGYIITKDRRTRCT